MAVVSPIPLGVELADQHSVHRLRRFVTGWRWLIDIVGRLPGQYTVSKLDAFQQFQLETSRRRAALVLLLMPLPCLVFNLLLECIPLADPVLGFRASGTYQLRCFLMAIVSSTAPALVKKDLLPEFPAGSWKAIAFYGVTQALICVATNVIIAIAADVYPVPFGQFTPILPMTVIGRLVYYRRLPQDPQFHAQSEKIDKWLGMEVLPIFVYPAFTAAFMSLTPRQQLWFSLLLPAIKLVVRRLLWVIAKHDDDLVGVITCGVGHLYHVLFTAMCLQNSKSLETLGAVALFNTVQMLVNCRDILQDAAELEAARAHLQMHTESTESERGVCATALACVNEESVARKLHESVPSRLLSTYPGYRRPEWMTLHRAVLEVATSKTLVTSTVKSKEQRRRSRLHAPSDTPDALPPVKVRGLSQILPWSNELSPNGQRSSVQALRVVSRPSIMNAPRAMSTPWAWTPPVQSTDPVAIRERFIRSLVVALHQTEMVLLRSYMTMFAMSFYVLYFVALFWLPNHRFFATQLSMDSFDAVESTVARLLLLCVMEAVFFAIYLLLIRRKLGISGVDQLAFVLWSQRSLVQGKFMLLIAIILGFPLAHSGNNIIWNA